MTLCLSVYLDLMRLLAATMVLLGHMNDEPITGRMLWRVAGHATEAVALFFVLSGFVIGYTTSRSSETAERYILARASRIYSVVIPAVVFTFVLDVLGRTANPGFYAALPFFNPATSLADLLSSLSFTNEIWDRHVVLGSNQPYWSLGFEVPYYVLFGVLFFPPRRIGIPLAVALAALFGPKIIAYASLWLIGYACFRHIQARGTRAPSRAAALGAALVLPASFAAYLLLHRYYPDAGRNFAGNLVGLDAQSLRVWLYYNLIGALFAANLVAFDLLSPRFAGLFARLAPAIRWAAGASFTLYLMHLPVMVCLAAVSPWPTGTVARLGFVGLGTVIGVLLVAELGERRKDAWRQALGRLARRLRIGRRASPPV